MEKYLFKVALFFVLVAVLDLLCGWGFDVLRSKARGGQTHKNEYIANDCLDDILILGSSKADHHYVPSVFEESLGLSCYNAGEMGCGIIPAYVRYKWVSARKKPKLVLYEVTPGYDYLQDDGYSAYLGVIRQHTENKSVRDVYTDFSDELEWLRLMSSMYRNNSKLLINLKDVLAQPDEYKGYEPLYGEMGESKKNGVKPAEQKIQIDTLKWRYMEKLVEDTKADGVPLVFVISPTFGGVLSASYEPFIQYCNDNAVQVINNVTCERITGKHELFQDGLHLNHNGAVMYSQIIVEQVKDIINNGQ